MAGMAKSREIIRRIGLAAIVGLLSGPAMAQTKAVPATRGEAQLSYAPVVRQVSPAVVNVYATRVVRERAALFDDPLFQRFFGGNSPFAGRDRMQQSLGSGVIVGADGMVVTNNHVIEGMTDVRVALVDQREFDADIVLTDVRSDLAVLKIRGAKDGFATLPLAEADQAEVGDIVLAIGNPYGLGQTVTTGIVSALRRVQLGEGEQRVFIQTDAAINAGNSGGALVDMAGRLIGINTAIFSRSGGSDGIGFATPSPIVKVVVDAARAGSKVVRRPWFGADLQVVTRELADNLGLDRPTGALVADVSKDSPAARAGLVAGDLVTALDGRPIEDPAQFTYAFTTRPMGSTVDLKVWRNSKNLSVRVRVEPAPEITPRDQLVIRGDGPFAGAEVVNLSPAVSEELGLQGRSSGVVIVDVKAGSPAARINFQKGDRILALNDEPVTSTRELERLNTARRSLWKVSIQRGGQVLTQVLRF